MWPQRAVAGGGTSKSGGGTGEATKAIMSSSLAQVHQLFLTSFATDGRTTNFLDSLFFYSTISLFKVFGSFLLTFSS